MIRFQHGRGWFVYLVSGLASADPDFVREMKEYGEYCPSSLVPKISRIFEILGTLQFCGVAHISRRGWCGVEIERLGLLQWKMGFDFRAAKEYFFLRLNGRPLLQQWPENGFEGEIVWVAEGVKENDRKLVANALRG